MTAGDRAREAAGPEAMRGYEATMRRMIYAAGVALAALSASAAVAQDIAAAVQPPAPAPSAPAARPLGEGVAAIVNDEIISTFDLRQRMTLIIATSGVRLTEQNLPQIQQQALRTLVDERLQMQELKRFEVNIPDDYVDREIGELAGQNQMTAEALFAQLGRAGVRPETLRAQMRAQIGWRELVTNRFRTRARIGEDQVDEELARLAAQASKHRYLIGEVYLDASQVGGMQEAMEGANALFEQLVKGAPFTSVARQFSNAPSAQSGGDAGWVGAGDVVPEVEVALANMDPGQLSRPIPTKDGVYLIFLREERSGGVETLINLRQAAIRLPADAPEADVQAATARLSGLRGDLTCENIQERAGREQGVVASDLGETALDELAPEFRGAVETLNVGQVSAPVRTPVGVHVLAVCSKRAGGAGIPTREQIGNRLFGQQLAMLAKRYMRDLRNSATIELR